MTGSGRNWAGLGLGLATAGMLTYAYRHPEILPSFEPAPPSSAQPNITTQSIPALPEQPVTNDGAFIGSNGYAWPIGRPSKSLYLSGVDYTLPCAMPNCHHDHTAAFDIAYTDAGSHNPLRAGESLPGEDEIVGEPVRAIIGGVIEIASYQDIPGCQRIQLHGDDGYYYWYGHLEGAIVDNGESAYVETGQQIATVGRWDCVGSSQSPESYSHGHIDRGCVTAEGPQRGGNDSCRDEGFVAIMNQLFAELPE